MRKKIVAANWKMNLSAAEALDLYKGFSHAECAKGVEVVVFPPFLFIDRLVTGYPSAIRIGGQNGFHVPKGAFTGEISMQQLRETGASAVLIGHSERRMFFHEDNAMLKLKVDAALLNQLQPFFCCGEPKEVRESNDHLKYVHSQLEASLFHLEPEQFVQTVIAYEPIWAIGTGLTASVEQAEEMHAAIRSWIDARYGSEIAENYSILYGGSCNPSNAAALFACPNVDGGLIGGASLKHADFETLIAASAWTTLNSQLI